MPARPGAGSSRTASASWPTPASATPWPCCAAWPAARRNPRAARHRSHASRPRRLRRAGARGQDRGRPAARAAQGLRQDLDDIGLPRLFDPGRLARDTGLVESRMILELAGRLLPAYRQRNQQALDDMPALIRALDIDDDARTRMLDGVAAQRPARLRDVNRAWDLETRILDEFGQMITLLDDNRPYWVARRTAAVRARRRPGALSEAPGPRRRPGPRTGPAGRAATGQPAAGHPALTYAAASPRQRQWSARRDSHSPVNCTIDTSAIRITITSNITRVS